jgi:uncharacterized protein (DUF1800 family)
MKSDRTQVAHLMRRAGFGATPTELDYFTQNRTYESIVDELVNPEKTEKIDDSFMNRYYSGEGVPPYVGKWIFRMINTKRPLEEKMALFLHHIFPVAWGKSEHGPSIFTEIDMFRKVGLSSFKNILVELSKDPAMIYWLDNNENHKTEINENYGRELLELFSMGVGNYTEKDIKNASRAFTGWTFSQPIPIYPQGHYPARFEFQSDDHDNDEKTFLGHKGNFNGEDIINIIVEQDATAKFVSRHLCNFFVEDEPQVPAWNIEPSRNEGLVNHLAKTFSETGGEIKPVLRELFNSESFKESISKNKVKSPTELVAGVIKQVGNFRKIKPGLESYIGALTVMGQSLLNPPTVEGWHTGSEWIDSGTLSERINFASTEFSNEDSPGVSELIDRAGSLDDDPTQLVDRCLDLLGGVQVSENTHHELVDYVKGLTTSDEASDMTDLIKMIVSTVDYQYA